MTTLLVGIVFIILGAIGNQVSTQMLKGVTKRPLPGESDDEWLVRATPIIHWVSVIQVGSVLLIGAGLSLLGVFLVEMAR